VQPPRQRQPSTKLQLWSQYDHSVKGGGGRSRGSWTNTNSAHSVDIEDYNVDYRNNYCNPPGFDNPDHGSCSNDNPTGRDRTSPDLFGATSKCPLSVTHRSSRRACTTRSATQNAAPSSYSPTTIPPAYPACTNTGHISSITATPLNPLSDPSNYGYAYGRPGFDAGAAGAMPYLTTDGTRCTNTTCTRATTSSTLGRYHGTTSTATTSQPRCECKRKHGDRPCCDKDPSSCAFANVQNGASRDESM